MWTAIIILALILIYLVFEYRIKKPGQIVLFESKGKVFHRKGKFFPRHFSLAIPNVTNSFTTSVEAEAAGKIGVNVRLAVTISPSLNNIGQLMKVGGWDKTVLAEAAKELDVILQGYVKAETEKYDVDQVNSEKIFKGIKDRIGDVQEKLGIEILSLTVQSVEPADKKISEAIRQKESARILEETEKTNQLARISAAQMKLKADEEIMKYEHELELKKYKLKEIELENESALANKKLQEELKRSKMRLEVEKDEVSLLKENPELLLLTPQVARLAEASQNLKNARTVVSLGDLENDTQVVGIFKNLLKKIVGTASDDSKSKR